MSVKFTTMRALMTIILVHFTAGTMLKCGEDILVHRGERKTLKFWSAEDDLLKVQVVSAGEEESQRPSRPATYDRIPGLKEAISAHTKYANLYASRYSNLTVDGGLHYAGNPDINLDYLFLTDEEEPVEDGLVDVTESEYDHENVTEIAPLTVTVKDSNNDSNVTDAILKENFLEIGELNKVTTVKPMIETTQSIKLVTFIPDLQDYSQSQKEIAKVNETDQRSNDSGASKDKNSMDDNYILSNNVSDISMSKKKNISQINEENENVGVNFSQEELYQENRETTTEASFIQSANKLQEIEKHESILENNSVETTTYVQEKDVHTTTEVIAEELVDDSLQLRSSLAEILQLPHDQKEYREENINHKTYSEFSEGGTTEHTEAEFNTPDQQDEAKDSLNEHTTTERDKMTTDNLYERESDVTEESISNQLGSKVNLILNSDSVLEETTVVIRADSTTNTPFHSPSLSERLQGQGGGDDSKDEESLFEITTELIINHTVDEELSDQMEAKAHANILETNGLKLLSAEIDNREENINDISESTTDSLKSAVTNGVDVDKNVEQTTVVDAFLRDSLAEILHEINKDSNPKVILNNNSLHSLDTLTTEATKVESSYNFSIEKTEQSADAQNAKTVPPIHEDHIDDMEIIMNTLIETNTENSKQNESGVAKGQYTNIKTVNMAGHHNDMHKIELIDTRQADNLDGVTNADYEANKGSIPIKSRTNSSLSPESVDVEQERVSVKDLAAHEKYEHVSSITSSDIMSEPNTAINFNITLKNNTDAYSKYDENSYDDDNYDVKTRETTTIDSIVPDTITSDGFKGYDYYEPLYDSLMTQQINPGKIAIGDLIGQQKNRSEEEFGTTTSHIPDFDTDIGYEYITTERIKVTDDSAKEKHNVSLSKYNYAEHAKDETVGDSEYGVTEQQFVAEYDEAEASIPEQLLNSSTENDLEQKRVPTTNNDTDEEIKIFKITDAEYEEISVTEHIEKEKQNLLPSNYNYTAPAKKEINGASDYEVTEQFVADYEETKASIPEQSLNSSHENEFEQTRVHSATIGNDEEIQKSKIVNNEFQTIEVSGDSKNKNHNVSSNNYTYRENAKDKINGASEYEVTEQFVVDYEETKASIPKQSLNISNENEFEQKRVHSTNIDIDEEIHKSKDNAGDLIESVTSEITVLTRDNESYLSSGMERTIEPESFTDNIESVSDYDITEANKPINKLELSESFADVDKIRQHYNNTLKDEFTSLSDHDSGQDYLSVHEGVSAFDSSEMSRVKNNIFDSVTSIMSTLNESLPSIEPNDSHVVGKVVDMLDNTDNINNVSDNKLIANSFVEPPHDERTNYSENDRDNLIHVPLELIDGKIHVSQNKNATSIAVPLSSLETQEKLDNYLKTHLESDSHSLKKEDGSTVVINSLKELEAELLRRQQDKPGVSLLVAGEEGSVSSWSHSNSSTVSTNEYSKDPSDIMHSLNDSMSGKVGTTTVSSNKEEMQVHSINGPYNMTSESLRKHFLIHSNSSSSNETQFDDPITESNLHTEEQPLAINPGVDIDTNNSTESTKDKGSSDDYRPIQNSVLGILEQMLYDGFYSYNTAKNDSIKQQETLQKRNVSETVPEAIYSHELGLNSVLTEDNNRLVTQGNMNVNNDIRTHQYERKPARKDDSGIEMGGEAPFFIKLPGSPNAVPLFIEYEPVKINYVPIENREGDIYLPDHEIEMNTNQFTNNGDEYIVDHADFNISTNNNKLDTNDTTHNDAKNALNFRLNYTEAIVDRDVVINNATDTKQNEINLKQLTQKDQINSLKSEHAHINIPLHFITRNPSYSDLPDPFVVMQAPDLTSQESQLPYGNAPNTSHSQASEKEISSSFKVDHANENDITGEVDVGAEDMMVPGEYYSSEHRGTIYGDVDLERLNNPVFSLQTKMERPTAEELINPAYTPFPITTNPPKVTTSTIHKSVSTINAAHLISDNEIINILGSDTNNLLPTPDVSSNAEMLVSDKKNGIIGNDIFENDVNEKVSKTQQNSASYHEPPSVDYSSIPAVDFRISYSPSDVPKFMKENPNVFPSWYPHSSNENMFRAAALTSLDTTEETTNSEDYAQASGDFNSFESRSTRPTEPNLAMKKEASARNADKSQPKQPSRISEDEDNYGAYYHPADIPGVEMSDLTNRHLFKKKTSSDKVKVSQSLFEGVNRQGLFSGDVPASGFRDDPTAPLLFGHEFFRYLNSLPGPLLRDVLDPPPSERAVRVKRRTASPGDQIFCEWNIKTEPGLYLLMNFQNLSAPYSIDCHGAYIEVERENNGYDARWCGNRIAHMGTRPHVIFAKSEVRITVYDDGDFGKSQPTGFEADIDVVDLFNPSEYSAFMDSSAYPHIRRLLSG